MLNDAFTKKCTKCPLHETSRINCLKGEGTGTNGIMFIAEVPKVHEEAYGKVMCGPIGEAFNKLLSSIQIKREECFVTYLVRCRPFSVIKGEEGKIKKTNIVTCSPYLEQEIINIKPKFIVPMGAGALAHFNPYGKITECRGIATYSEKYKAFILPMYNPAVTLKTAKYDVIMSKDMRYLKTLLQGSMPQAANAAQMRKYVYATDIKIVKEITERIKTTSRFTFDIEATSLTPWKAEIISIAFSWKTGTGVCIPLLRKDPVASKVAGRAIPMPYWGDQQQEVIGHIKEILGTDIPKGGHNAPYDILCLKFNGIEVENYAFDTILEHHLLDEEGEHNLDNLSWVYTDRGGYKKTIDQYLQEEDNYLNIPLNVLMPYNAGDADVTFELDEKFIPDIEKQGMTKLFNKITMGVQRALLEPEYEGILVDVKHLDKIDAEYSTKIAAQMKGLEEYLTKLYNKPIKVINSVKDQKKGTDTFNINSPKQLQKLLFVDLKLAPIRKTKTGFSTDDDTLAELAKKHDLPQLLMSYRGDAKLKSTYIDGIRERLDKNNRIHTDYKVFGTCCITEDSYIWTEKGLKKVSEFPFNIAPGFKKHKEILINKEGEPEETSHLFSGGIRDVIKLDTVLGISLKGTKEHPLMILRDDKICWSSLEDIQLTDFIQSSIGMNVWGDSVALSVVAYKKKTNARSMRQPSVLTPELSRLMGYWVAEGNYINQPKYGAFGVAITNKDENVIKDICTIVKNAFDIEATVERYGNVPMIKIRSIELYKWWQINVGNLRAGAKHKNVPDVIKKTNFKNIKEFIRGLTADACIGIYNHTRNRPTLLCKFTSDSKQLMLEVHQLLLNAGVCASFKRIKKYENHKKTHVGEYFNKYRYAVDMKGAHAFNYIKIFPPLITDHINRLKNTTLLKQCMRRAQKSYHIKIKNGAHFLKIQSKVNYGKANVFDFTLPKTHSFVANGLISHNTGRLSSSNPNLQNIPRDGNIKDLFIAGPGNVLIEADMSQHELRVLASVSKDAVMRQIFNEGKDIHMEVAMFLFGKKPEEIDKEMRVIAKQVNFGIAYDISAPGLADTLNGAGVKMSTEAAQEYINKWFRKFHGAKMFLDDIRRNFANWKVIINVFGRKRRFPKIPEEKNIYNALKRQATNFPISSSASDLVGLVTCKLKEDLKHTGAKLRLTVHDALVFEVPEEKTAEVTHIIKAATDITIDKLPGVCFKSDVKKGHSWGHTEAYEEVKELEKCLK